MPYNNIIITLVTIYITVVIIYILDKLKTSILYFRHILVNEISVFSTFIT